MGTPKTIVTTVREVDADGNVISETVTTSVTEKVIEKPSPPTGMYL